MSTGGNLCVPQLGLKVTYQPGACAIIRGTALDHLVTDYTGTRFFLIGTNHESVKRNAWRALGRLPPLPPRRRGSRASPLSDMSSETDHEEAMNQTCVNHHSDDEDNIPYTNAERHGAGALEETSPWDPYDSDLMDTDEE
jgi:hypothetical protein